MDSIDFLNQFLEKQDEDKNKPLFNYCLNCNISMEIKLNEYICPQCGLVKYFTVDNSKDNIESNNIVINNSVYYQKFDYCKIQKNSIMKLLKQNSKDFDVIPDQILNETANIYNMLQQIKYINDDKKFVKRGSVKNEILAFIIYNECLRNGIFRQKSEIIKFMKLTKSFSNGEEIMRLMATSGIIDYSFVEESPEILVNKYFELLEIQKHVNSEIETICKNFVCELVNFSIKNFLGMESQINSKVVASIWIAITCLNINIKHAELEKATNVKKSTFNKFSKYVFENEANAFNSILDKYKMKLPEKNGIMKTKSKKSNIKKL